MVARQRRHRHRRPRQSLQRLRLSQAPTAPPRRLLGRAKSILARLRLDVRRRRAIRFDHAAVRGGGCRGPRPLRPQRRQLSSLLRRLHQRVRRRAHRRGCVGRRHGRLRRRRQSCRCHDRQRRSPNRPGRQLHHRDAKRPGRRRSHGRPLGPRPLGPCAWIKNRRCAHGRRRHVRQPVRRQVARLRPGAHRLCLHAQAPTRPDRRAGHLCGEGA